MFRVHEEQIARLGAQSRGRFVVRMSDYLARDYKPCVADLSRPELEAWVGRGVDRAGLHGITTEPEVAQWLLLALVLGEDASDSTPWVKEIADDRDLLGLGKVRKLLREARARRVQGIDLVAVVPEVGE